MLVSNQDKPPEPEPNFPCRLDRTCDSLTRTFSMCLRPAVHNGPEVVLRGVTDVMIPRP